MPDLPTDPIDPYERALTRRVRAFSDAAVQPVDATAVAASTAAVVRPGTVAGRLFGSRPASRRGMLLGAGAVLLVAAVGMTVFVGANGLPSPTQQATATQAADATQGAALPGATPTEVPDACTARALSGHIASWEGAAGHRIATVIVRNEAALTCRLPSTLRAALTDATGSSAIYGPFVPASGPWIDVPAGASVRSMVDVANYCGPDLAQPVTITFTMPDGGTFTLAPATGAGALDGVPPCNGPGAPGDIQMLAFKLVLPG